MPTRPCMNTPHSHSLWDLAMFIVSLLPSPYPHPHSHTHPRPILTLTLTILTYLYSLLPSSDPNLAITKAWTILHIICCPPHHPPPTHPTRLPRRPPRPPTRPHYHHLTTTSPPPPKSCSLQDPFPLFPGEELSGEVALQIVPPNQALRVKAIRDLEGKEGAVYAGGCSRSVGWAEMGGNDKAEHQTITGPLDH